MTNNIYSGPPTTVTIEASWEIIHELDLDTFEGQQYDKIENVIRIDDIDGEVEFETTRSIEAYHRGEPNAGRATHLLKRSQLERILIDGKRVWGGAA